MRYSIIKKFGVYFMIWPAKRRQEGKQRRMQACPKDFGGRSRREE
jgi:hypothetical protein